MSNNNFESLVKNFLQNQKIEYTDHFYINQTQFGRSLFNMNWAKEICGTPNVILDIGCYDGGDSIRFLQRYPDCKVYSFEASPERQSKIESYSNEYGFKLIKSAVMDYDGVVEFYNSLVDNQRIDAQGSIYKHSNNYKKKYPRIQQLPNSIMVECITIETFCKKNNIDAIDVAHIDVEGAELNVIKGFGNFLPKIVYIETLGDEMFLNGSKVKDIDDFLISKNYFLAKDLISDRLYVQRL